MKESTLTELTEESTLTNENACQGTKEGKKMRNARYNSKYISGAVYLFILNLSQQVNHLCIITIFLSLK